MPRTRGELESAVANVAVTFQREQQGRGPTDVRAHVVGELLLVRSRGIFTQTEANLAASEQGRRLIKSSRIELRSINHGEIEAILSDLVGLPVVRSYYDLEVEAAEQVEVYVFAESLERRFPPKSS
jgi:uncharacterized protein YbcI